MMIMTMMTITIITIIIVKGIYVMLMKLLCTSDQVLNMFDENIFFPEYAADEQKKSRTEETRPKIGLK